jgi:gliding motility-associated-like protein
MKQDFDKSLQDLLGNHTEQPPLECWDKIASRLDALQAANAGAATSANTSAFSQFAGSMLGKIAVTALVAASAATAVYLAVKDNDQPAQTAQQQEVFTEEQDAYKAENASETKTETVYVLNKTAQTNPPSSTDTVREENAIVFSPTVNVSDNQSNLNTTITESTPQPQEIAPQLPVLPSKKETAAEPKPEKEATVENKDETETPEPKLGIPNVITPNGDDVNDYFEIPNLEQLSKTQLYVYTRDGKVVYNKSPYDNRWDGRGLPDGVYYYIFQFTYQGEQFMRKGSVTIMR